MLYHRLLACLMLLFILFSLAGHVFSADLAGWQSFTSTGEIRQIEYFNDSLQVMTAGGWLKIDPIDNGFRKIVNTDGLGTNDLYDIIIDGDSLVWLAAQGRLIKVTDDNYLPFLFYDRNDQLLTLYSLADDGDFLWVGTSSGLALFSKTIDGGQMQDFYFRFGNLNDEAPVFDILLVGDSIWIATGDGLAFADKSDPVLLKSFANWGTIKPSARSNAEFDSVFSLAYYNEHVYMGAAGGIYRVEINPPDTLLNNLTIAEDIYVRDIKASGDSLLIYGDRTLSGYYSYNGNDAVWTAISGIPFGLVVAGLVENNIHWIGSRGYGIYSGNGTVFARLDDGGLPGSEVTSITSDADGKLAATFQKRGLAEFNDTWRNIPVSPVADGLRTVVCDDSGGIWAGSWGGGLHYVNSDTTINYRESNSNLHGVPGAPYYVVVNRITRNARYIFMINYLPSDQNTVHWIDINDFSNQGVLGVADGLPGDFLNAITASDSVFVVGTQSRGIYYYYFGGNIQNKGDDSVINLTDDNSWLGSDEIMTVAFDSEKTLWVGTKFGLARWDRGIDRFIKINMPENFGPEVLALAFDERNNIWMGAANGLAVYESVTGRIELYSTLNSGLIDNNINGLTINPITNDLWVATRRGISRLASRVGPPAADIEQVIAFPNPFIIDNSDDILRFNYNKNAVVRIYTINGELIWENNINIPWRGTNQNGQDVAPGAYLYLLTDDQGDTGKGKVLLVRE